MMSSVASTRSSTFYTYLNHHNRKPVTLREQSLMVAQARAEEIIMGCENFTDLVVGVWSNMSTFYWGMKKL